jgi:uncharacterized membrane protein
MVESLVRLWVLRGATLVETISAVIVIGAALQATWRAALSIGKPGLSANLVPIRRRLSEWLVLALEILIASDIIRTAVSPSWVELGQLAAIVALRVAIDYTLLLGAKEE